MPLDRNNAQARRDAAEMRATCVQQRLAAEEQQARIRSLKVTNDALRERLRGRRARA